MDSKFIFLKSSCILIIIGYILYGIIGFILGGLEELIRQVSQLDVVIIVALITGTVSLIGVILTAIVSKIIDYKQSQKRYLEQKREVPYQKLIELLFKFQNNLSNNSYTEDELKKDMYEVSTHMILWGSNNVILKWDKFKEFSNENKNTTEILFILEEVFFEIRKDLGYKKLKKGDILAIWINDIKNHL